jgi:hypothetical protein
MNDPGSGKPMMKACRHIFKAIVPIHALIKALWAFAQAA